MMSLDPFQNGGPRTASPKWRIKTRHSQLSQDQELTRKPEAGGASEVRIVVGTPRRTPPQFCSAHATQQQQQSGRAFTDVIQHPYHIKCSTLGVHDLNQSTEVPRRSAAHGSIYTRGSVWKRQG